MSIAFSHTSLPDLAVGTFRVSDIYAITSRDPYWSVISATPVWLTPGQSRSSRSSCPASIAMGMLLRFHTWTGRGCIAQADGPAWRAVRSSRAAGHSRLGARGRSSIRRHVVSSRLQSRLALNDGRQPGRFVDLANWPIEALSPVDCFHPSEAGHRRVAAGLWNRLTLTLVHTCLRPEATDSSRRTKAPLYDGRNIRRCGASRRVIASRCSTPAGLCL